METSETVKEIRSRTGLNRKEFCQKFGIPLRTMEEWETGRRIPPEYIPRMLAYYTRSIDTDNARNEIRNHYDIVEDAEGNKVVIINDLRFKSCSNIDWNTVEQCLKEYVGSCVQILETSDEIYIGKDFPETDELGQQLLNHAIEIKGKLFSVDHDRDNRIFEFRHSHANMFHGFLQEDISADLKKKILKVDNRVLSYSKG